MKQKITIALVIVVLGIGAFYLLADKGRDMIPPPATVQKQLDSAPVVAAPDGVAVPVPTGVKVSISNFSFNPGTLTVKVGTTVTWTNEDSAPHTVTSDSGSLLNSPRLSQGQSFSFTFTEVGSTSYHCAIHPMMKGTVIVTN